MDNESIVPIVRQPCVLKSELSIFDDEEPKTFRKTNHAEHTGYETYRNSTA